MSQFEISITPVIEAGETMRSISGNLDEITRRLECIHSGLSEKQPDSLRKMSSICKSIKDICLCSKKLERTLLEVAQIYKQAERCAFSDDNRAKAEAGDRMPILSNARGKQSVLLFGNLLLPDWLQAAVIKYEQNWFAS